jgi:hypothetical protein
VVATDGMDCVVDDTAIGSPMDAVAAWWSTQKLHRVLASTLAKDEEDTASMRTKLDNAIQTAPIGSMAKLRGILARAVFVDEDRGAHIAKAIKAIKGDGNNSLAANSTAIIAHPSYESNMDIQSILRCAMVIAHLRRFKSIAGTPHEGLRLIQKLSIPGPHMSLLGCAASMELIELVVVHKAAAETFQSSLERLVGGLRVWIGGPEGDACGLDSSVQHAVVDRCLSITKSLVGMDFDAGYGSLDEEEGETC